MSSTFRTRDFIAMILLLYLTSIAFDPMRYDDADLSASIRFAFVIPQKHQYHKNKNNDSSVLISMLDIDGDDSSEALAIWRNTNKNDDFQEGTTDHWTLQILDLSRISLSSIHKNRQQHPSSFIKAAPFQPKVLFNSSVIGTVLNPHQRRRNDASNENIQAENVRFYPLAVSTGHIIFPAHHTDEATGKATNQAVDEKENEDDPTKYYYCGTDWQDASQKCEPACPSGSGCPDGQRCFAECKTCPSSSSSLLNPKNTPKAFGEKLPVEYHTTVAGGWPSICTAWSQGQITLHTITAEKERNPSANTTGSSINQKQSLSASTLQLRQLWNVSILVPDDRDSDYRDNGTQPILELEEVAIAFVDPISSAMIFTSSSSHKTSTDASDQHNYGIVLVTGTVTAYYYPRVDPTTDLAPLRTTDATFVIAYDAYTGQRIWHTTSSYEMEHLLFYPTNPGPTGRTETVDRRSTIVPILVPRHGQISSILRRRSGMVSLHQRQMIMGESTYQDYEALKRHGTTSHINCLKEYRRSVFTTIGTLPYQYDGTNEYSAKVIVTHFDHQGTTTTAATPHHHQKHLDNKQPWHKKMGRATKAMKHFARHVEYGRPNVVVVHNYQGIHVHALRNGRSLCHISLSDNTAYDDIDHDGTIDSVQLFNIVQLRNGVSTVDDGEIAQNKLYHTVQNQFVRPELNGSRNGAGEGNDRINDNAKHTNDVRSCYTLSVTSGFTSAEPTHFQPLACQTVDSSPIHHAPILLIDNPIVSSMSHHYHPDHVRNYKDVIVALSNGMIGRMHGKYGDWVWKNEKIRDPVHRRSDATTTTNVPHPTWDDSSVVTLQQLYVNHYKGTDSPILLAGQESVAILSSTSGRVVTMVTFPQLSTIQRPVLLDVNGDGTSDIVIVTKDAIWGYTVFVRTTNGMSTSYRIVVGLVMMGLLLAHLRNRFGPHPGKRSTDL